MSALLALEPALKPELVFRASAALVAEVQMLGLGAGALREQLAGAQAENPALEVEYRGARHGEQAAPESPLDTILCDAAPALDAADRALAEAILGSLDAHGFLGEPAAEAAGRLGVPAARVARVLAALRAAAGPALGAAGPRDALLLQLAAIEEPWARLAELMVEDHLEALAAGALAEIAARLGETVEYVLAARTAMCAAIRPYPNDFAGRDAPARPPDLVIVDDGRALVATPVEELELVVRVSSAYRAQALRGELGCSAAVAAATAIVDSVHRRWATLRRVVGWIASHQARMVREGPEAARPLTRAQVAQALSLHESTISRAVHDRTAQLPGGRVLALREFFPYAPDVLRELTRLVEAETGPRSDAQLAAALAAAGYPVARRTVVKYRRRLGIPPASAR